MAIREILEYPINKDALRKKSISVRSIDRNETSLIKDLKDTLNAHPDGIGLAAPQINVHQRVVVVRLGARSNGESHPAPPIALVNPKILESRDKHKDFDGCLSFPGLYGETIRPHYLRVTGWDERGKSFDRVFKEFDAVLVHHEIDHLDGVLFIDRVESIEDLYRVREVEDGKLVRVPVSVKL
jgi:peptide deformylase